MSLALPFEGQGVIVTGAGQGIGEATARLFAERGAGVVLADIKEGQVHDVAEDIRAAGGNAFAMRIDVTDTEQLDELVAATVSEMGNLTHLVNNAGVARDKLLFKQPDEDFEATLAINLTAPRHLAKRAAAAMTEAGIAGTITNASSTTAEYGLAGQTAYGASKGGIETFTMAMASEFGRYGIRINAVAPGPTETPMLDQVGDKGKDIMAQRTMLGRRASAEEIAEVYAFLASPAASYITGTVVKVDGGYRG